MEYWRLNCPHCNATIANGSGSVTIPKVWIPYYRCKYCGNLIKTPAQEYITMSVTERTKIRSTLKNSIYIALFYLIFIT